MFYLYILIHMFDLYIYIYIYIYMSEFYIMYLRMIYIFALIYTSDWNIHIFIYMYIYGSVCVFMFYIYVCVYIYIYIYENEHTHIHTPPEKYRIDWDKKCYTEANVVFKNSFLCFHDKWVLFYNFFLNETVPHEIWLVGSPTNAILFAFRMNQIFVINFKLKCSKHIGECWKSLALLSLQMSFELFFRSKDFMWQLNNTSISRMSFSE